MRRAFLGASVLSLRLMLGGTRSESGRSSFAVRARRAGVGAGSLVAGNAGLEGVYFWGGLTSSASRRAGGREACGCVRGVGGGAG